MTYQVRRTMKANKFIYCRLNPTQLTQCIALTGGSVNIYMILINGVFVKCGKSEHGKETNLRRMDFIDERVGSTRQIFEFLNIPKQRNASSTK